MKLAGPECSSHENELVRGEHCCVHRRAALIEAGWMHFVNISEIE
jgi:hypothetical protein